MDHSDRSSLDARVAMGGSARRDPSGRAPGQRPARRRGSGCFATVAHRAAADATRVGSERVESDHRQRSVAVGRHVLYRANRRTAAVARRAADKAGATRSARNAGDSAGSRALNQPCRSFSLGGGAVTRGRARRSVAFGGNNPR